MKRYYEVYKTVWEWDIYICKVNSKYMNHAKVIQLCSERLKNVLIYIIYNIT